MKTKEKFYLAALASTSLILFFLIFVLPVASAATEQRASPVGLYAYIANGDSNSVSVIDTRTNTVTATVPVGRWPEGVAVSPDGTKVYIPCSDLTNKGTVYVIDTAINEVTFRVCVGKSPRGVAVTPDGKKVYVSNMGSNDVSVINTTSNKVTATVEVESCPRGVVVNSKGTKVYVTNFGNESVSVIDTTTNKVTSRVPVGGGPLGVAVNLDGTRVYVANWGTLSHRDVSIIDTTTNTVIATVESRAYAPTGVAVTPDGKYVYVTNLGSNNVSVIDTITNTVSGTVKVGSNPAGVAITPDGKYVYVTNPGSNNVSVIDTITNTVTASVNVEKRPYNLGQFIVPPPVTSITITSPNGGDKWQRGTSQVITWNYTGDPDSLVKVDLLKGGVFYRSIKSVEDIGSGGSGSCVWNIPSTLRPRNDYKVKISGYYHPEYNNSSIGNFSISSS